MNMHAKALLAATLLALPGFAAAQATPAAADQAVDMVATPPQDREDPNCLRYTGSVIVAKQNLRNERAARQSGTAAEQPVCSDRMGRSYTQDDLRRTGATDISDALRRLDPSIH